MKFAAQDKTFRFECEQRCINLGLFQDQRVCELADCDWSANFHATANQFANRIGTDADFIRIGRVLRLELPQLLFSDQILFGQVGLTGVDADIALEVENLLKLLQAHVEQGPDAAGHTL